MIFVTVGTQLPFDRLIKTVDEWAANADRKDVYAQVGPTSARPAFIRSDPFIGTDAFTKCVNDASVIIAHAGMGSIITALELGKPILVMPRRASLGEHRNEHQLATAKRLAEQKRVTVAWDEVELVAELNRIDQLEAPHRIGTQASPQLIQAIQSFIAGGRAEPAGDAPDFSHIPL